MLNIKSASASQAEPRRLLSACTDEELQQVMFWRLQQHASAAEVHLEPG